MLLFAVELRELPSTELLVGVVSLVLLLEFVETIRTARRFGQRVGGLLLDSRRGFGARGCDGRRR